MRIEIVKFRNGKYGIRKRSFWGGEGIFKDFLSNHFWWGSGSQYFKDCQLDDLEEVTEIYNDIKFGVVDCVIDDKISQR